MLPGLPAPLIIPSDPYDRIASAYFKAMAAQYSNPSKQLINNLVVGLRVDGVLGDFDEIFLIAGENPQGELLNLIDPSRSLTAVGSPTRLARLGYTVTNSAYFSDGATHPVGTASSQHRAIWFRSANASGPVYGAPGSGADYMTAGGGTIYSRMGSGSEASSGGNLAGHMIHSGLAGTHTLYRAGVSLGSAAFASGATTGSINFGGGDGGWQTGVASISLIHRGIGVNAIKVGLMRARFNSFLTAIGAN